MTEPRDVRPGTPFPSEQDCAREGDVVDFGGQRLGTGPCVDRDGRPYPSYATPPVLTVASLVELAGTLGA